MWRPVVKSQLGLVTPGLRLRGSYSKSVASGSVRRHKTGTKYKSVIRSVANNVTDRARRLKR